MPTVRTDWEAARVELQRVLASRGFARNERMSRFLRFITERHLEGSDDQLKESTIAVEVFHRKPDHDPAQDSIVRTEAGRLRARLTEYYAVEGGADPLIIELPKGGYIPSFRSREPEPPLVATPPGRRLWPIAALALLLTIAAAVLVSVKVRHQSAPITIAVLPLENLSHDPANDYFADGLTDELIRNLSLIEGLSPRSRISSFGFKAKPRNAREAGKELNADYILEGSVLRIDKRLRVDVELVRARDDFPMWSARYDRTLTDIFAIQDEISRGIVNSLRLKLGRGRRRYETSTEAYDLYLQARAMGIKQGLAGELQSISRFEGAIAKDPSFAPAYAGLAAARVARSGAPQFESAEELTKMQAAAQKALELDPLLAEAYSAMGMVYARQAQWERSEKNFRRALELDPHDSVTQGNFALSLLFPLDRISEAVQQLKTVVQNDPLAFRAQFILVNALMADGRFDEAASYCEKLSDRFPGKGAWLGRARIGQGRFPDAIELLQAMVKDGDTDAQGYLGNAYGRVGRRQDAEKIAANNSDPYIRAMIFAGLGDKDRTIRSLEGMAVLGPVRLGRNLNYSEFRFVRSDPRVEALRQRVGLPPDK